MACPRQGFIVLEILLVLFKGRSVLIGDAVQGTLCRVQGFFRSDDFCPDEDVEFVLDVLAGGPSKEYAD